MQMEWVVVKFSQQGSVWRQWERETEPHPTHLYSREMQCFTGGPIVIKEADLSSHLG